jgi:thiamine-monophosphate kinase
MLVENIHFDLMYTPLRHLGYKAVVVNLSDICAMNARPEQITIALALSSKFTLEAVEELYKGVEAACEKYQIDLVGGDTCSSPRGLVISITAIGRALETDLVHRTGAVEGDLLCVSGDLGGAYCGLQILEREKRVFLDQPEMQPDLEKYEYIISRQLRPEARLDVVDQLRELGVKPTAMIDISDGLASEIFHLCKSSNRGMKLFEDKIPIDPLTYQVAIDLNLDPSICALNGGEDYELLFTIKQDDYDKIKNSPDITVIGHCTDVSEGKKLISKSGSEHDLLAQGWKAF